MRDPNFKQVRGLAPRTRQAIRLHNSGLAKTKREAASLVGVTAQTISNHTAKYQHPEAKMLIEEVDQAMARQVYNTAALMEELSRRALRKIGSLMDNAHSEAIQLKAAIDLADRGRETSKVQKHQVESFTVNSRDAKALAEALVNSAKARQRTGYDPSQDYIGVTDDPAALPSG